MIPPARATGPEATAAKVPGAEGPPPAPATPARIRALAHIPSTSFDLTQQERYLYVSQMLPSLLTANALAVQSAYREYQQRALARDGLRKMYIGTLTLTLILAVFGALILAVALSRQLARPLLLLAEGMRQVASGDLSRKTVFGSRDELGGLTRSFAAMTEQLSEARELVDQSVTQLEGARLNLQTILDNLTAGVIVFDHDGRIETVNPGATRILRLPLLTYRGRRLDEVPGLPDFAHAVMQRFELHASAPDAGERDQWQDSFELRTHNLEGRARDGQTLLVRGAAMPHGARLLVFDDITEVVSAQRSEAWSEVARRLAHEIKNPLTPIQLSAERLQHKLESKLEGTDQTMLVRSVGTIVNQVEALKRLVNEFRDYARLPAARLAPVDLNALAAEVLALYANAQEAGRLHFEPDAGLPLIEGDGSQLRQVIHNLVQNALDAVAEHPDPVVRVRTELARNEQGQPRAVRLLVCDNGPGFSDSVLKRAFEPYVTTKSKGTGLGLAVVKKIADEHGARVRLANLGPARSDRRNWRRPGVAPGRRGTWRTSFDIIFQTGAAPEQRCGRRDRPGTGALRIHGHHPCSRRRTGHPRASVRDPDRRGAHGRGGRERGAGAHAARDRTTRPGPARHLDARCGRHHAAEGVECHRLPHDAGHHDERARHHRHRGGGDQARRHGLPREADHAAEAAARGGTGPGQTGTAQRVTHRHPPPPFASTTTTTACAATTRWGPTPAWAVAPSACCTHRRSGPSPNRASTWTARCARRAMPSRRATSSSTWRRKTAA